jgi:hypothetical protein
MRAFFLWVLVFAYFIIVSVASVQAQLSIAHFVPIADARVKEGYLVSFADGKYTLSREAYDSRFSGVVINNPAVLYQAQEQPANSYAIESEGSVYMYVSNQNGVVKKNDLITTSSIPGIGMKASKSGYVVGIALEDAPADATAENVVYKIRSSMNVRYYSYGQNLQSNVFDIYNLSQIATQENPITVLKYLVASATMIFSLVAAFYYFGRVAQKGIEALGRNPLAGNTIRFGIALNLFVTLIIIGAGVGAVYLILRI